VNKGAGMRMKEIKLKEMLQKRGLAFVGILLMTVVGCSGFNGGSWTNIGPDAGTKFIQVAVGNEKTVIARDAAGEVYKLRDGKWEILGGGKARWIAAGGDGSIFAVGKETRKLYRRSGDVWEVVPGIEKLSRVVALDEGRMWGLLKTKDGSDVWQFEGGKWARPLGADGKTPAANWRNIAVAPGVFIVTDMSGNAMMRSSKVAPVVVAPVSKPVVKKAAKKKSKKASKKATKKAFKKKSARKKGAAKSKKGAARKKSAGKSTRSASSKKRAAGQKRASGSKSPKSKTQGKKKSASKKKSKKASKKASKKSSKKKSAGKKSAVKRTKSATGKKSATRKKSAGKKGSARKSGRKKSAKKKAPVQN
jgi:hypothetical protein